MTVELRQGVVGLLLALLALGCSGEAAIENWIRQPTAELPPRLSQLGLYGDPDLQMPAADLTPYAPRHLRFADGNRREYHLFLPVGAQIDNAGEDWIFPAGATLIETFYLEALAAPPPPARRIETRILHKTTGGTWSYGAYVWNEAGDEATLSDPRADAQLSFELPEGTYRHTVPKQLSCLTCHENQSDFVIGLSAAQLAGDGEDPDQLDTLASAGAFTETPAARQLEIDTDDPLEREVLTYFYANCSYCHHPESTPYRTNQLDLRLAGLASRIVDVEPVRLVSSDGSTRLIAPGDPERSLIYILMSGTYPDPTLHMPPLGRSLPDTTALERLRQWILTL